jgi:hypothetical protein
MAIKHLKFKNDEELVENTSGSFKNVPANNDNLEQMKKWLEIFVEVYKIDISMDFENRIREIECNLGINIPPVLRLVYLFIGNNHDAFSTKGETKLINYRLLNIDEIKVEKNVIVNDGYKGEPLYETDILIYGVDLKDKKFYGIDLYKDWDLMFYKKWLWVKDNMPLYKNLIVLLVCLAISKKDNIFKTNIKNIGSWKMIENVDKLFKGDFERFNDFKHYDHTIYYNRKNGALGWMRAGNSCPEILIGCNDKEFTEEIIKKYEFNKAKIYK